LGADLTATAQNNSIINGGFEEPPAPIAGWSNSAAPTNFVGWTVEFGDVDVVGTNYFASAAGAQSLDLNGLDRGGVYQDVATVSNLSYRLTFAFGANTSRPEQQPALKRMEVDWNSNVLAVLQYDVSGQPAGAVHWQAMTFAVFGTGADRLHFRSLTLGAQGPAIDDVLLVPSTNPVPAVAGLTIQSAVQLCWPTAPGAVYQVQWASQLDTNLWYYLGPPITGDGSTNCFSDPIGPNPARFYRVLKAE
jgi:hypothetical protein